jgi:chromosome segregation ATPase
MAHTISRSSLLWIGLVALALTEPAAAQTARRESGNNAQLMQQMQQLAAERTQLAADNARLKRELDEMRKERDTLKGEREGSDKRARSSEAAVARVAGERERAEADLTQLKERTNELVAKFRETVAALREVEADRGNLRQQLETRSVDLKSCVDRNAQLYTMNDEILDRLEGQGVFSSLARAEPFTRIKRTQLENLADDYRARAEDAKLAPAPAAPSTNPAEKSGG